MQGRSGEGVPEVAVQQAVPREVGNLPAVVTQEQATERVPRGEHGGQRPRVAGELAEQRVDAIQPEEKREADGDQEVNADERGEPDPDAERDRGRDPLGRLLPPEEIGEQDLQPSPDLQPVLPAAPKRARELPLHGAAPKWSKPRSSIARRPRASSKKAPSPDSIRPTRLTDAPHSAGGSAKQPARSAGVVKSSS